MLRDEEIDKLCQGRVIMANVPNSSGGNAAGPHYAVILDSDEQIWESDSYYVAVISNNNQIDPEFSIPVPARLGLTGYFICSWYPLVDLPGITHVGPKLLPPELRVVLATVRSAMEARRRSTES